MTSNAEKACYDWIKTKNRIRNNCIYGLTHFCDGSINWSEVRRSESVDKKPPCPLFKNGCKVKEKGEKKK